jgi:Raf kinase inhibitor-like YbhB/YbcL family protein
MNRAVLAAVCTSGLLGAMLACSSGQPATSSRPASVPALALGSEAFANGKPIPVKHTGDGADVSPPLAWSGLPAGTKELALIADDPDAPSPQPWVHWVAYKIPADTAGLPEGASSGGKQHQPAGALAGKNSFGKLGYNGPAPPKGKVHRYYFRLYALDKPLDLPEGADKPALLKALAGHILAQGVVMGTYQR